MNFRSSLRFASTASITTLTWMCLMGCEGGAQTTTGTGGHGGQNTGGDGTGANTGGNSSGGGGGGQGGSAPTTHFDCAAADGDVPALKLTQVASGLSRPVLVQRAAGDDERLYIVEQTGKIQLLKSGALAPEPFLDIQSLVADPNNQNGYHEEQGLLGVAFHPDFVNNGRFFVHYSEGPFSDTSPTGDTRIVEYKRSSDNPDKADPNPVATILSLDQPYPNHNGGSIEFGPDGFLYIGMGDGGAANDPQGNGQDLNSLLAKILRIDVSTSPYSIPPGNLPGGKPEIWDYGLRNPWRFAFDPCNGDLYIGDVGQDKWEEIDYEPAGQGNKNYGWNTMEATHCFEPMSGCDQTGLTLPVAEYDHTTGKSVTGGVVYRGSAIPGLRGTYFYADFVAARVWTFRVSDGMPLTPVERTQDLQPPDAISSFGQDNFGEVYVTSLYGGVYRVDAE